MLSVKGKHYIVDCEGMHHLCLACRRYGNETTGCVEQMKSIVDTGNKDATCDLSNGHETNDFLQVNKGPWSMVPKTIKTKNAKG